jgi:hypothetical protein
VILPFRDAHARAYQEKLDFSTISSASGVLAVRGTPTRPFFCGIKDPLKIQHVRSNAEMHLTKGDSVGEIVWHTLPRCLIGISIAFAVHNYHFKVFIRSKHFHQHYLDHENGKNTLNNNGQIQVTFLVTIYVTLTLD